MLLRKTRTVHSSGCILLLHFAHVSSFLQCFSFLSQIHALCAPHWPWDVNFDFYRVKPEIYIPRYSREFKSDDSRFCIDQASDAVFSFKDLELSDFLGT
uniref:Putative secreted protein n=1 Tax=Anopheles darlingi TaxID=43151 RepID=A0A2M4DD96_ANODA